MKKLSVLLALFCCLSNPIFSQTNFSPDVKRIAVFKNGYAFTYREGEAQINNGWVYTTNTPVGVLGTVWGYSTTPNVKVMQLLASENEKREIERVTNLTEVLIANEGARIRFVDSYNTNKVYEGTYEIIGVERKFARLVADGNREVTIALKTETGVVFFLLSSIRNVEILEAPKYDKPKLSKENRLAFNVEGAKDGQSINLGVAALERGIRWIPAYRVEVKGSPVKEAKLELEATLINELADLKNSEVYFVVGVPHFLFQESMSPLSMNTAFAGVSSYFQRGAGNSRRDSFSNAIMTQQMSSVDTSYTEDADAKPTSDEEEKVSSFSAEQLYLYQANQYQFEEKRARESAAFFADRSGDRSF